MHRTEKPVDPLIAIKDLRAVNKFIREEPRNLRPAARLSSHSRGNPCHRWGMVKGFDLFNDLMAAPEEAFPKTSLDRICSHGLWVTNSFVVTGDRNGNGCCEVFQQPKRLWLYSAGQRWA
jgi:hypothetical protein